MSSPQIIALLKTGVFSIVVAGLVAVYLPSRILGPFQRPQPGILLLLGCLLIVLGTAAYLRCAWDFAITGLGTPAIIDPPKVLISRGMHRFVRNPMYIAVLLVVTGEAALFRARLLLVCACVLWVLFHLFVVFYEEPHLKRAFGESYEEYCRSVHRWLPRR